MQKQLNLFVIIYFLITLSGNCQSPDPLTFFPHHQGDLCEYILYDIDGNSIIIQNEIINDSLGDDGRYYITMTSFSNPILDTVNAHVFYNLVDPNPWYKLNADSGDVWIAGRNEYSTIIAICEDVFQAEVLPSHFTTVKKIVFRDSVDNFIWTVDYLASGFGLVRTDTHHFGPEYLLVGTLIDGIAYGTLTAIKNDSVRPDVFHLSQNYPNPFNGTTTIRYRIGETGPIQLKLFDLLGRHLQTLIDQERLPGEYSYRFNMGNLSSGIYIYQLQSNRRKFSKKMMLVR